jgi:hypothetical protein
MFCCQVLSKALVLKEEIDMDWIFPRKITFGDGNALHNRGGKCQKMLVEVMDF